MFESIKRYFTPSYELLAAIHPQLPWALLVAAVFSICYLTRKSHPVLWEKIADAMPMLGEDPGPVLIALRKLWQAIPSAVMGAVTTAIVTGIDLKLSITGALVALLAPLLHELAKWAKFIPYRGEVPDQAKSKFPKAPTSSALVLLLCVGCGPVFLPACGNYQPTVPDECDIELGAITVQCKLDIDACASSDCVDAEQAICNRKIAEACK